MSATCGIVCLAEANHHTYICMYVCSRKNESILWYGMHLYVYACMYGLCCNQNVRYSSGSSRYCIINNLMLVCMHVCMYVLRSYHRPRLGESQDNSSPAGLETDKIFRSHKSLICSMNVCMYVCTYRATTWALWHRRQR